MILAAFALYGLLAGSDAAPNSAFKELDRQYCFGSVLMMAEEAGLQPEALTDVEKKRVGGQIEAVCKGERSIKAPLVIRP